MAKIKNMHKIAGIYTGINCDPIIKQNDGSRSSIKIVNIRFFKLIKIVFPVYNKYFYF